MARRPTEMQIGLLRYLAGENGRVPMDRAREALGYEPDADLDWWAAQIVYRRFEMLCRRCQARGWIEPWQPLEQLRYRTLRLTPAGRAVVEQEREGDDG